METELEEPNPTPTEPTFTVSFFVEGMNGRVQVWRKVTKPHLNPEIGITSFTDEDGRPVFIAGGAVVLWADEAPKPEVPSTILTAH